MPPIAGSPHRFHAVVDRHFAEVAAFLARRVGPDTAEDLAQEVFVTAFRKRHRFDPAFDSARPWLLGIANRAVAGHRRAERRQLELYRRGAPGAAPAGGRGGGGPPPPPRPPAPPRPAPP